MNIQEIKLKKGITPNNEGTRVLYKSSLLVGYPKDLLDMNQEIRKAEKEMAQTITILEKRFCFLICLAMINLKKLHNMIRK